jgi:hypothetical protein
VDLNGWLRAVREAEQARRWDLVGSAMAGAAEIFGRRGDAEDAARAWLGAAEAWRRDDRPDLAARAARTAAGLLPDPRHVATARVVEAGCLLTSGEVGKAADALARASERAHGPAVAWVADARVELALVQADVEGARAAVAGLSGDATPLRAARAFRSAQVARLDGRLPDADRHLDEAAAGLDDVGLGAIEAERAELAWCRGRVSDALDAWRISAERHRAEGRRAPYAAARAAEARGAALLGATSLFAQADLPGLRDDAAARGLALVALDLDVAIGLARRDVDAVVRAAAAAAACGASSRAGRAYGWAASQTAGAARRELATAAARSLGGAPLLARWATAIGGDPVSRAWLAERGVEDPCVV